MQRPERAELARHISAAAGDTFQISMRGRRKFSGGGALFENSPSVAHVPIVGVQLHSHQLSITQLREVQLADRFRIAVGNLVDPSTRAIGTVRVMAFT